MATEKTEMAVPHAISSKALAEARELRANQSLLCLPIFSITGLSMAQHAQPEKQDVIMQGDEQFQRKLWLEGRAPNSVMQA